MSWDRGGDDLRDDVAAWMMSLAEGPARPGPEAAGPAAAPRADLAALAARCYVRAGWWEDACRAYDRADDVAAGPLHERAERFERAASAYERAADLSEAARCYLRAGDPGSAVRCLVEAGRPIAAAWILADRLQSPVAALLILAAAEPRSPEDRAAVDLIRARCDALGRSSPDRRGPGEDAAPPGHPAAAPRLLRRALETLRGLAGPDDTRRALIDRALSIAEQIGRPDLAALAHAAAVTLGVDGAADRWTAWARQSLGDTWGFPIPSPHGHGSADGESHA
jgi:tetratricopeptide (TPR) repeat protein